ncbi:MAG: hypothetical protein JO316_23535 [Abitibacteriaceae bacterium]|nr:hypothetical protein [Abditibacteriaceae bacterium]
MTKDQLQALIEPLSWEDLQVLRQLLDERSHLQPPTQSEPVTTEPEPNENPLKGSVLHYDDPFEPAVPIEDWEVLQ